MSVRQVVETIAARLGVDFHQAVEIVDERPGQDATYVIDSSKARAEFNWSPQVDLAAGIDEVVGWVEANMPVLSKIPWEYQHRA
jgi:dTDP-glucose 4,6-dehydratase